MESHVIQKFNVAVISVINKNIKEDIDDTLLQKFISYLKESDSRNGILEEILERTELLPLLREKLSDSSWEFVNQTFTLQLVNVVILHLLSTSDIQVPENRLQLITLVFSLIEQVLISSSCPSVEVAAIECLISLQSRRFNCPTDPKLVDLVFHSLSDKSVFVQKVAQTYLVSCLKCPNRQCRSIIADELQRVILGHTSTCNSQAELQSLVGALDILLIALKENCETVELLESCDKIHDVLLDLTKEKSTCSEKACELLAIFFNSMCCDRKDATIKNVLHHLLGSQEPLLFFKYAYFILRHAENIPEDSPFLNILYSPLIGDLTGSNFIGDAYKKMVTELLLDKSSYKKLLMSSLSMLYNLVPHMHLTSKLELAELLNKSLLVHKTCRKTLTLLVQLQHRILLSKGVNFGDAGVKRCLETLREVLSAPAVTASIFNQIMQMVVQLLNTWALSGMDLWRSNHLKHLGEMLNRKLVDRQWEIIDSSLEFIVNILEFSSDIPQSEEWIFEHNLHSAAWLTANIPSCEGYVKASAIQVTVKMFLREKIVERFMLDEKLNRDGLLRVLLQHVQDRDVFVQRAAAVAIHDFASIENKDVCNALHWCSCSIDWEIKLTALTTWEKIMQKELCSEKPVEEIIKSLYEAGFLSSLVKSVTDCERKVRLLSAKLALQFRTALNHKNFKPATRIFSTSSPNICSQKEESSNLCKDPKDRSQILDEVLNINPREYLTEISRPSEPCVVYTPEIFDAFNSCDELLHFIWETDLLLVIEDNAVFTDMYTGNFESLIDDILAAVDVTEAQIIDCY